MLRGECEGIDGEVGDRDGGGDKARGDSEPELSCLSSARHPSRAVRANTIASRACIDVPFAKSHARDAFIYLSVAWPAPDAAPTIHGPHRP